MYFMTDFAVTHSRFHQSFGVSYVRQNKTQTNRDIYLAAVLHSQIKMSVLEGLRSSIDVECLAESILKWIDDFFPLINYGYHCNGYPKFSIDYVTSMATWLELMQPNHDPSPIGWQPNMMLYYLKPVCYDFDTVCEPAQFIFTAY